MTRQQAFMMSVQSALFVEIFRRNELSEKEKVSWLDAVVVMDEAFMASKKLPTDTSVSRCVIEFCSAALDKLFREPVTDYPDWASKP